MLAISFFLHCPSVATKADCDRMYYISLLMLIDGNNPSLTNAQRIESQNLAILNYYAAQNCYEDVEKRKNMRHMLWPGSI
jgi:hypothetical protein